MLAYDFSLKDYNDTGDDRPFIAALWRNLYNQVPPSCVVSPESDGGDHTDTDTYDTHTHTRTHIDKHSHLHDELVVPKPPEASLPSHARSYCCPPTTAHVVHFKNYLIGEMEHIISAKVEDVRGGDFGFGEPFDFLPDSSMQMDIREFTAALLGRNKKFG